MTGMSKSEAIIVATNRLHRIRELEGLVKGARKDVATRPGYWPGVVLASLLRERGALIDEARSAMRVVVDNSHIQDLVG